MHNFYILKCLAGYYIQRINLVGVDTIQTLISQGKYTGTEIDSTIVEYQGKKLPQVRAKKPDKKEGGGLERTVDVAENSDGKFIIDGKVAQPFKPQYDAHPSLYNHSAQTTGTQEYQQPASLRNEDDPTELSYHKIQEMAQGDVLKNMGFVEGNGRHYTPTEKEKRMHRKYAKMTDLENQMAYSAAFN